MTAHSHPPSPDCGAAAAGPASPSAWRQRRAALRLPAGRPALLASVKNLAEAECACACGVDVLDLKDPARGALGAWPPEELARAARRLAGRVPLSATTGDLPCIPARLRAAAAAVAASGVDVVKVGFFAGARREAIAALAGLARDGVRLVAVLFADRDPPLELLPAFAAAGFFGVVIDTAAKGAGGLRDHLPDAALAAFLGEARSLGLIAGLAGSLGADDVPPLARLGPDLLGFRGALCRRARAGELDPERVLRIRNLLVRASGREAARECRHERDPCPGPA